MGFVLSTGQASRHIVEQVTQQFPVYQRQIARVLVRTFFLIFVTDAALVVLLSMLLFITTTVSWIYHGLQALAMNALLPVPPQWFDFASFGLSLSLSVVMFYLAYRFVPRRRPRAGAALAGAVLASV